LTHSAGGEGVEGVADGMPYGVDGAGGSGAQQGLELGEGLLDGFRSGEEGGR
jgi:hypothetical protein